MSRCRRSAQPLTPPKTCNSPVKRTCDRRDPQGHGHGGDHGRRGRPSRHGRNGCGTVVPYGRRASSVAVKTPAAAGMSVTRSFFLPVSVKTKVDGGSVRYEYMVSGYGAGRDNINMRQQRYVRTHIHRKHTQAGSNTQLTPPTRESWYSPQPSGPVHGGDARARPARLADPKPQVRDKSPFNTLSTTSTE